MTHDAPGPASRMQRGLRQADGGPNAMPGGGPNVELHIEELILEGFGASGPGPQERHRLVAAVERELSRLFLERGIPAGLLSGGPIDRLRPGPLHLGSDLNVSALGGRLAEAIYGSFGATARDAREGGSR